MTEHEGGTVGLAAGEGSAEVALRGAEPIAWRIGGRDLLWSGDPAHWSYRAPILFPVVGASKNGDIRVGGQTYPMPQHGFARTSEFALMQQEDGTARLRLSASEATLAHYPFPFELEVTATLTPTALSMVFEVANTGSGPMPYGLGFHPAFRWPFDARDRSGHTVVFEAAERPEVPEIAPGGLIARRWRPIPLSGRELPLSPDLFKEALPVLNANSRSLAFVSPTGARIEMTVDNFPHLAIWTRPDAPFLSLEAWTAHADYEDAEGELLARPSMTILRPGEAGRHRVVLRAIRL